MCIRDSSHASLLISMGENPLLIKERLGHEKIQTTLGTYGHLYPNTNVEVAQKLTGILTYTPATTSVADYTSSESGCKRFGLQQDCLRPS